MIVWATLVLTVLVGPLCAGGERRVAAAALSTGALWPQSANQPSWQWVAQLRHGAPVSGTGTSGNANTGTLLPATGVNAATTALGGRIAFVAGIAGSPRNQGVFTADASGLRAIAIGCGGGGGSGVHGTLGDVAPGGGLFARMFQGTAFAPALAADGSVLFVADLVGGPSSRALFLFEATAQRLVRIAGVGDPSPLGGSFASIGPGVHAADGAVLFVAQRPGVAGGEFFHWQNGIVQRLAASGDALPLGGSIALLATEVVAFVDGTNMAIGPLPFADACGTVAFRVHGSGGAPHSGIVVRRDGQDSWWLRSGDATPAGGVYIGFGGPVLGGSELAVYAEHTSNGGPTAGWFVGKPNSWRRALGYFDLVDGGQCLGLAMSRAPMTPLDDRGDLVVWCDLDIQGGRDRLVLCRRDGTQQVLARRGEQAPGGGLLGELGGWPSLDSGGRCVVSAQVQFAAATCGHFTLAADEPRLAAPPCAALGSELRVDATGPLGAHFALAVSTSATEVPLPPFGVLRIGPDPIVWLLPATPFLGYAVPHAGRWTLPDDAGLIGTSLHFQALALLTGSARLTEAVATRMRP